MHNARVRCRISCTAGEIFQTLGNSTIFPQPVGFTVRKIASNSNRYWSCASPRLAATDMECPAVGYVCPSRQTANERAAMHKMLLSCRQHVPIASIKSWDVLWYALTVYLTSLSCQRGVLLGRDSTVQGRGSVNSKVLDVTLGERRKKSLVRRSSRPADTSPGRYYTLPKPLVKRGLADVF